MQILTRSRAIQYMSDAVSESVSVAEAKRRQHPSSPAYKTFAEPDRLQDAYLIRRLWDEFEGMYEEYISAWEESE